ncbi:MAG: diguanylate cyclase, partial [Chloroflexi bacterium]|nr:diguanylate cyclase [Chloroflexota bacterium]
MLFIAMRSKLAQTGKRAGGAHRLARVLPRRGLRGKILALYVLSGVAILLTTAALYARTLAAGISDQYHEHALAIWRVFDATYPSAEDLRGPLIQDRLARVQETNPDIHEIRLYAPVDDRFLLVASSNPATIGQPAALDDLQPMLQDRPIWREFVHRAEAVAEMGAPIHTNGQAGGVLAVHFRLAARDVLVWRQVLTFLGVGGLGGMFLLAALYWELERVVLQPLLALQRQATAIAQGNLDYRNGIHRGDEVGQLAVGLNRMTEALEQREQDNLRLHDELRARYHEAEQRAVRDPITGLYNHGHFHERLSQELDRSRRFRQPLAVLFCDLDRFKTINDTHGHQVGDRILQQVAATLQGAIRGIDIAARYGGEEFTVILPNTGAVGALQVAERIRFRVGASAAPLAAQGATAPVLALGTAPSGNGACSRCEGPCASCADCNQAPSTTITATFSIGIACYPDDATTEADLIHRADLAMYHAKRLGRNQVRSYQELQGLMSDQQDASAWEREAVYFEVVQSLAAAVDTRDRYTHRHSDSVARYATALARALGLEGTALTEIAVAGLLHDVGKIGVPDQILSKPGPLTEEEWQKMREHPVLGKFIVQHITAYDHILPQIHHHHHRRHGAGYPERLAREHLPLGARIL